MKRKFLTKNQEKKIVKSIQKAESVTSGEIRVHLCFEPVPDHFKNAVAVFEQLKMNQTKDRNGVLIHVSPIDRNITIICDSGIDAVTPDDFWEEIKNEISKKFKKGKYRKGLTQGIKMVGKALQQYFPFQKDDKNELPDEISWS